MPKIKVDKSLIKVILAAIILSISYYHYGAKVPLLANLSLKTTDVFNRLTFEIKPQPAALNEITIISIDDPSFMALKRRWPWPRSFIAEFLNRLTKYQPKIISLDLVFSGESQNKNEDKILKQAIKNAGNVILSGYIAADGNYNKPFKPLREAALDFGLLNKPRDKDLIVRSTRLFFPRKDKPNKAYFSFGLKTIIHYLGINKRKDFKFDAYNLILKGKNGETRIPVSKKGVTKLKFQARYKDFEIIPFYKIMQEAVPKEKLQNKIVLIGPTAEIFHDRHHTPLGLMPGVALNANEILMYLSKNFIREAPDIFLILLLLSIAIISAALTYKLSLLKGLIALGAQLTLISILCLLSSYNNYAFDYFAPLFMVSFVYLGAQGYKYIRLLIEATILRTMAITDGLTGLYIHRYLVLKLDSEFKRAKEEDLELNFLIMDIDHFKKINDTYGHEEGNVVLKNIATILQESSRKVDVVARYGGEEFCAILPGTHDKGTLIYAQRIRKSIENFDFPYKEGQSIKSTISIGIASLKHTQAQSAKELIALADKALYEAKETGRNRICVATPPSKLTE